MIRTKKVSTRVDQLPPVVAHHFIQAMYQHSDLMGDLFQVCLDLGMRNVEGRELMPDMVNLETKELHLYDSKQVRSHITKKANQIVEAAWIVEGKRLLKDALLADVHGLDVAELGMSERLMVSAIKNMADSTVSAVSTIKGMDEIGGEKISGYESAKQYFYTANMQAARKEAAKSAPTGRIIDLSPFPGTVSILKQRLARATDSGSEYLFPTNEIDNNRARGAGFVPVTRQSAKRIVDIVAKKLRAMGSVVSEALNGIRLGLHSCRKAAVQRIASEMDMLSASIWIGHGNGDGNLAITQDYLDKSSAKMQEINRKLTNMNQAA